MPGHRSQPGEEDRPVVASVASIILQVPLVVVIGLQPLRAAAIIIQLLHLDAVDTTTLRVAAGIILRALPLADGIGRPAVRPAATIMIEGNSRPCNEASISIRAIVRPPHRRLFFLRRI